MPGRSGGYEGDAGIASDGAVGESVITANALAEMKSDGVRLRRARRRGEQELNPDRGGESNPSHRFGIRPKLRPKYNIESAVRPLLTVSAWLRAP